MLRLFDRAHKVVNVDMRLALLTRENGIVRFLLHLQAQVLLVLNIGPFLAFEAV